MPTPEPQSRPVEITALVAGDVNPLDVADAVLSALSGLGHVATVQVGGAGELDRLRARVAELENAQTRPQLSPGLDDPDGTPTVLRYVTDWATGPASAADSLRIIREEAEHAHARANAAEAQVAAVRELHQRQRRYGRDSCTACLDGASMPAAWPCASVRALDAAGMLAPAPLDHASPQGPASSGGSPTGLERPSVTRPAEGLSDASVTGTPAELASEPASSLQVRGQDASGVASPPRTGEHDWLPEIIPIVDALRSLDWTGFDPTSLDDLADIAGVIAGELFPPDAAGTPAAEPDTSAA